MSEQWSLNNWLLPISYRQFVSLTTEFKAAAEKSVGTPCKLQIEVLDQPLVYTTYALDDDMKQELNEENQAHTMLETETLADLTADVWNRAAYVGLTIRPADEKKAPAYAFAWAEFKGTRPRCATFYILADSEKLGIKDVFAANHPMKLMGDGFDLNGVRSLAMPASVLGMAHRAAGMVSDFRRQVPVFIKGIRIG